MNDSEILEQLRRLEEIVKKRKRKSSNSETRAQSPADKPQAQVVSDPADTPSARPQQKRRRIIIYSDSSDNESENESTNVTKNDSAMKEDDIDSVLGEDPTVSKDFGEAMHATLSVRWNNILQKGIKKDNRSDLIKKYLPPANCSFILPPKLNDEIKAAVQDNAIKRDAKLEQKQLQLGAGITCIGRAIGAALQVSDKSLRDQIVKHLGDGGQILTDLHYLETITRRSLLVQSLNKTTKEAIKDLPRDQFLFGEGLPEKLKAIKACSKSAADIKVKQPKPATSRAKGYFNKASTSSYNNTEALNWRGPSSRRTTNSAFAAGAYRERRTAAAAAATATATAPRRQQASLRAQPRRQ